MPYISAEVPLFIADVKLSATLEVRVRPVYDQFFPDNVADDLQFFAADGKWHTFQTHQKDYEILALIARHDPPAYAEIVSEREAQRERNYEEQDA